MLHQQLKDDVKKAMFEKNPLKLNTVRGLVAACTNQLVATKHKPDEMLQDEEVIAVIRRAAKQRQDSIEQFKLGGREDLIRQETTELEIIRAYLPPELSEKEIIKLVKIKMTELGITKKKDAGKLIGAVTKDFKGKADGATIKIAVEKLLN